MKIKLGQLRQIIREEIARVQSPINEAGEVRRLMTYDPMYKTLEKVLTGMGIDGRDVEIFSGAAPNTGYQFVSAVGSLINTAGPEASQQALDLAVKGEGDRALVKAVAPLGGRYSGETLYNAFIELSNLGPASAASRDAVGADMLRTRGRYSDTSGT